MAQNNSPDNEFDPEMERILQEHFDAEGANLIADADLWARLESRLEEPTVPSFFSRLLGYLTPVRDGRLSPAFAIAALWVAGVAAAAVVWMAVGSGGDDPAGGLAVATQPERERIAVTAAPLPAAAPASTNAPPSANDSQTTSFPAASEPAGPGGPAGADGGSGASGATGQAAASEPTALPYVGATEAPTPAAMPNAGAAAAPAATAAPASTAMPYAMSEETAGRQGEGAVSGAGTPPDTTFEKYGRQPFVAAAEDNVSTFSLDTDRTSYHLALNWARSGYEVDPDSVRAEEWVNSFDYGYASPPYGSREFAIQGDLYPHPLDETKRLVRIAFQAPELPDDRPLNVTLVLDASGSMADGNRVDIAWQAAESIRQSLRAEDRIAVVHFTDHVIDHYTVEHLPPEHERVKDSINLLRPNGSTNVQAGLNLGIAMAGEARTKRPNAHNYVILMSDGVANVDATNPFAILETAYDPNARNPLRLITIGVGINNYNDLLLEQLAQHGNGWYRYLNDTAQAEATFQRDNWLALSTPFADQTRAQVTWNPDVVERWRIVGYENRVTPDHTFTQDRKEFAELYSGTAATVFYELDLRERANRLPNVPLGRVELRWIDPDTGGSRNQSATLSGNPYAGFEGYSGSLARFGAIVALSADLYGLLPNAPASAYAEVYTGLSGLLEQLHSLRRDLGELDAYHDFLFLLEHITGNAERLMPPSAPSGYSR